MENSMEVPQNIKNRATNNNQGTLALSIYLKKTKTLIGKDIMHPHIHCRVIYNSQNRGKA